MTILSIPLHPEWMGEASTHEYLRRVQALGVGAGELQVPSAITAVELQTWRTLAEAALALQFSLALHLPAPPNQPVWTELLAWIEELAAKAPLTVIVLGATANRPHRSLAETTVAHVRTLCASVPATVTIALESGWNRAAMTRLSARLRHWQQQRRSQRLQRQRPTGVGSGLGTVATQPVMAAEQDTVVDPPLTAGRSSGWWGGDGWISTGTRDATLAIVEKVDRPNCVIAWDLTHDWLSSVWETTSQQGVPDGSFLRRVGYVRVHDALPDGTTHLPLVVGNVAYASQLRALSRVGFDGTACVAVRYTKQAQPFGSRWRLLERSLTITRQSLRVPYSQ